MYAYVQGVVSYAQGCRNGKPKFYGTMKLRELVSLKDTYLFGGGAYLKWTPCSGTYFRGTPCKRAYS